MKSITNIQNQIFNYRNIQVMVDRDLAVLFGVETKVLNQAVKRNIERFPASFRFQLTKNEKNELVTNCDRFENLKHASSNPFVFTEQGIAMLSAVLRSDLAIQVSIQIMNAFIEMRKFINNNAAIFQRLEAVEQRQILSEQKFEEVFSALEQKSLQPKQGIFYNGQIFDAYVFVVNLIKSAKTDLIIIDNYIDESTLLLLAKRASQITCTIYTQKPNKNLLQDIKKYNSQYPKINIKTFDKAHDRFLIIDNKTVYHIGASLKDLGKKWFAFSKMEMQASTILNNLNDTQ